MKFEDTKFWKFWKKYGEHITALSILLFLIISCTMLYKDWELKKEINENCGWGEEDYRCMCEKSDVIAIENKIKGEMDLVINLSGGENVSLVG